MRHDIAADVFKTYTYDTYIRYSALIAAIHTPHAADTPHTSFSRHAAIEMPPPQLFTADYAFRYGAEILACR